MKGDDSALNEIWTHPIVKTSELREVLWLLLERPRVRFALPELRAGARSGGNIMVNQTAAMEVGRRARSTEKQLEDELVRLACNGDSEAFGQLYERLFDRVYRYIYFRVTDDLTAEDLTSNVFLKAWEHLPRFSAGDSPFIAWLYTIAHNTVIDHYRTKKQTAPLDEISALAAPDPLPDEQYNRRFDAESLRRSLQQLTELQREVVTMKLINGMTTDEIAARLRKSPGAVRALQMRALQSLAHIFEREQALEPEREAEN